MNILQASFEILFIVILIACCVESLFLTDATYQETLIQVELFEISVGCFGLGGSINSEMDGAIFAE